MKNRFLRPHVRATRRRGNRGHRGHNAFFEFKKGRFCGSYVEKYNDYKSKNYHKIDSNTEFLLLTGDTHVRI